MSYTINSKNVLGLTGTQLKVGGDVATDCTSVVIMGNVGIGTTDTTTYALNVNGNTNIANNLIINNNVFTTTTTTCLFSNNVLSNPITNNKQLFTLPANTTITPSNVLASIDTNPSSGLSKNMSLTYGLSIPRMWVAGGNGGNTIAYSSNGITWTGLGITIFGGYARVLWDGNSSTWVASGTNGITLSETLKYSTNGITWTSTNTTNASWIQPGTRVWDGGSVWVAVGSGGLSYSIDNVSWTRVVGLFQNGAGVAWNGGSMWVAVGVPFNTGTRNTMAYSTNGTTWTGLGLVYFEWGNTVAWNGSLWVVGGTSFDFSSPDLGNSLIYSTNGTTWTGLGKPILNEMLEVHWSGSMWVGVGTGTGNTIAYSSNGTTWTGLGTTIFLNGTGVAFNKSRPNTITFTAGNTIGTVTGTNITTTSSNRTIEVVSDSYYQSGLISTSVTLLG